MFGIQPGALADASLADKLQALSGAFSGDTSFSHDLALKLQRQQLAQKIAEQLAAGQGAGADNGPPQPAAPTAPEPAPASDDPMLSAALSPALTRVAPDAVKLDAPVSEVAGLPQVGATRQSLYRKMLPMLIEAAGKGVDPSGLANVLKTEDYVGGLPQKQQPQAEISPTEVMGWNHADSLPQITEQTPGGTVSAIDRRTGTRVGGYTAPDRDQPVTIDRVLAAIIAKRTAGGTLTPSEQDAYDRWKAGSDGFYGERAPRAATPSTIVAGVLGKVQAGGVESLTAGEKAIWDRYNKAGDPLGLGALAALGGDDEGDGLPKKASPGADKAPPKAPPRQKPAAIKFQTPQQSGAPPATALSQLTEGVSSKFANGQIWKLRGGKPVFVGMAKN